MNAKLDEIFRRVKLERERKLLESIRRAVAALNRRDPVIYVRVHVKNRVSGEAWSVDFDTWEQAQNYLHELAWLPGGRKYRIYTITPGLYDVGPFQVSMVKVRRSWLKKGGGSGAF